MKFYDRETEIDILPMLICYSARYVIIPKQNQREIWWSGRKVVTLQTITLQGS